MSRWVLCLLSDHCQLLSPHTAKEKDGVQISKIMGLIDAH